MEANPIGWKDHLIKSSVNGSGLSCQNDHIGPLCIETKFQHRPQASRSGQPAGLKKIAGMECVEVSTGLPLKKLASSTAVQAQPGHLGVPKQLAHAGTKAAISDSL